MQMMTHLTLDQIKAEAFRLGFSACGAAPAEALPEWRVAQWKHWLSEGCQGEMDYLARNEEKRYDPRLLVEGAQSVVSLALNYCPSKSFSADGYRLSRYAYGRDYHEVMKEKLFALMGALGLTPNVDGRAFVDTAPVDEHYWAWRCGLGALGRHTQLIIPKMGTFFFLGELVLTVPVEGVLEMPDNTQPWGVRSKVCLHCRRCIDACPTGALSIDRGLDARLCLSYLTIEHRGDLPDGTGKKMGNNIYGCDRCTEVCPHTAHPIPTEISDCQPSVALLSMKPEDWQQLTVDEYRKLFKGSAVKRAKYEGLTRNIAAVKRAEEE